MKTKKPLAVLALCTALLLGGCGKAAPTDSGTDMEKGVSAGAESDEAGTETAETGEPENHAAEGAEPDAGEDEYLEKIYLVSGTWYGEDGEKAVICEDGSFTLYGPDGGTRYTGWLACTEEDENSLRYDLCLEDGELVPETYFSVEPYREEIALCEGGGAVAFRYDGPAPEVQTREVRVRIVTEPVGGEEYDTFTAYEGEYPVLLLFTAAEPVTDFTFLSIRYSTFEEDSEEEDSLPGFDVVELYDGGTLDRPLLVTTSFPGDVPTNGFSYRDAYGGMHWVAVMESGYDGSLMTTDFRAYYG